MTDGEWLFRDAQQLEVNFPERTIDLIVIPWDEQALVPIKGRMVFERVRAGSFDGIEKRANRIRVNRDHARERTVGRAVAFHPEDSRGLVARVKISRTPLGDETLELANDDSLDASAAFLPMPDGSLWTDRDHVEHTKCWLGHIAMTPEPAYEGARVLAVRTAQALQEGRGPVLTPNLDAVRGWLAERRYVS